MWRVFATTDSIGFATLSLSNNNNRPFEKDAESLRRRFQRWADNNEKLKSIVISQNELNTDGWIIVTRKAFQAKKRLKTTGHIVASKDSILFEFFIESDNIKDVDCVFDSFSKKSR